MYWKKENMISKVIFLLNTSVGQLEINITSKFSFNDLYWIETKRRRNGSSQI